MSAIGATSLYFVQPGTTINDAKFLDLKKKLDIRMIVLDCNVFMNDGAPHNRPKQVKNCWQEKMLIYWTDWQTIRIQIRLKTYGIS